MVASDFHATLLLSFDNDLPIEEAMEHFQSYIWKDKPTVVVFFVFDKQQGSFLDKFNCMVGNKTGDLAVWEKNVVEGAEN